MPTRKEWPSIMGQIAQERIDLSSRKNSNYAGGGEEEDAFFNFKLCEHLTHGKISVEAGLFVRLCDKFARLANLLICGTPDAVGESIEDTVKDLSNYSDILLAQVRERAAERALAKARDEQQAVMSGLGQGAINSFSSSGMANEPLPGKGAYEQLRNFMRTGKLG